MSVDQESSSQSVTQPKPISRRGFLGTVGAGIAAAAFPTFIPSSVLAAPGRSGANGRVNVGLIGVGNQGSGHFTVLSRSRDMQLVAIADCHRDLRRKYASEARCQAYADFRDLLNHDGLDAVVIAVPDHWHAVISLHAIRAGLDVYCEKPLTLTIDEGKSLVRAARQYDTVFQTGSQQRSMRWFRHACELVRNGYLGELKEIWVQVGGPGNVCNLPAEVVPEEFDYDMWLGPAPQAPYNAARVAGDYGGPSGWRRWKDYAGGGMTDWGAHHFDIVQWALDMDHSGPVSVVPEGHGEEFMTMTYANGVKVKRGNGLFKGMIQFVGSRGIVGVGRHSFDTEPESLREIRIKPGDVQLEESRDHMSNWVDAIRKREKPLVDVAIGHRSATVCHIGNIAYELDRPLKWDPGKEQFVGDEQANRLMRRSMRGPWSMT